MVTPGPALFRLFTKIPGSPQEPAKHGRRNGGICRLFSIRESTEKEPTVVTSHRPPCAPKTAFVILE
jgi:hypothetical protein